MSLRQIFVVLTLTMMQAVAASECSSSAVYFLQNSVAEVEPEDNINCVKHTGISVGGWGLSASKKMSISEFVDATTEELEKTLSRYLDNIDGFDSAEYSGFVMLDIEHPISLRTAHKHIGVSLSANDLSTAFQRRINAARKYFPKSTIVIYGYLALGRRCAPLRDEDRRLAVLQKLIDLGTFKNVDYGTVVLYLRGLKSEESEKFNHTCQIDTMQRLSLGLANADMKLMPLFGSRVYNRRSPNKFSRVSIDDGDGYSILEYQVDRVVELGFSEIGIWSSTKEDVLTRGTNESTLNIFDALLLK